MSDWNCPVCDRDFEDEAEMDDGICRKCAAYTSKTQSACAAGSWRTDVENAPKDTECQLWCKLHPANNGHDIRIGKFDSRSKTWTDGVWQLYVTAFATINPPEIEG